MSRIGEILVGAKAISPDLRDRALQHRAVMRCRFGSALLDVGGLTESMMLRALSVQKQVASAAAEDLAEIRPDILRLVPAKLAARLCVIPFQRLGRTINLAMRDPTDLPAVDEIAFLTGLAIRPFVALEVRLYNALAKHYGATVDQKFFDLAAKLDRLKAQPVAPAAPSPNVERPSAAPPPPPPMIDRRHPAPAAPPPSPYGRRGAGDPSGSFSVAAMGDVWSSSDDSRSSDEPAIVTDTFQRPGAPPRGGVLPPATMRPQPPTGSGVYRPPAPAPQLTRGASPYASTYRQDTAPAAPPPSLDAPELGRLRRPQLTETTPPPPQVSTQPVPGHPSGSQPVMVPPGPQPAGAVSAPAPVRPHLPLQPPPSPYAPGPAAHAAPPPGGGYAPQPGYPPQGYPAQAFPPQPYVPAPAPAPPPAYVPPLPPPPSPPVPVVAFVPPPAPPVPAAVPWSAPPPPPPSQAVAPVTPPPPPSVVPAPAPPTPPVPLPAPLPPPTAATAAPAPAVESQVVEAPPAAPPEVVVAPVEAQPAPEPHVEPLAEAAALETRAPEAPAPEAAATVPETHVEAVATTPRPDAGGDTAPLPELPAPVEKPVQDGEVPPAETARAAEHVAEPSLQDLAPEPELPPPSGAWPLLAPELPSVLPSVTPSGSGIPAQEADVELPPPSAYVAPEESAPAISAETPPTVEAQAPEREPELQPPSAQPEDQAAAAATEAAATPGPAGQEATSDAVVPPAVVAAAEVVGAEDVSAATPAAPGSEPATEATPVGTVEPAPAPEDQTPTAEEPVSSAEVQVAPQEGEPEPPAEGEPQEAPLSIPDLDAALPEVVAAEATESVASPELAAEAPGIAPAGPEAPAAPPPPVPSSEVEPEAGPLESVGVRLASAETRDDVAEAVLEAAQLLCDRTALFIAQPDRVIGWSARPEPPEGLRSFSLPWSEPSVFSTLRNTEGFYAGPCPDLRGNRKLLSAIGSRMPAMIAVVPVTLKGKSVLFLMGEFPAGAPLPQVADMRRLASMTAVALEILLLRNRLRNM